MNIQLSEPICTEALMAHSTGITIADATIGQFAHTAGLPLQQALGNQV